MKYMKKFFISLFASVLFVAQSSAQGIMNVKVPVFEKIVKVTAENVTFHKSASSDSPKLMVVEEYDDMGDPYYELSWSSSTALQGQKPAKTDVAFVINEVGEWYEIMFFTSDGVSCKKAYVKKKCCMDAVLVPLDHPNIAIVPSGKYQGYCLECVETYGGEAISVGKLKDNACFFIAIYSAMPGKITRMGQYSFDYGKDCQGMDGMLDVRKLAKNSSAISSMIRNAKNNMSFRMCFKLQGDDFVRTLHWNEEVLSMVKSQTIIF